tara:strand:+ start:110235 stop:111287 length:1053 start_codon:yes stop_codon:yes gene_type:complete
MDFFNSIAEYISVNTLIVVVGCTVILSMVAFLSANMSQVKGTKANAAIIVMSCILLASILVYPRVLERAYIGKADMQCEVFDRNADGDILYEFKQVVDPATGKPMLINGEPAMAKFPKLKRYYFPLQDIKLQEGVLRIRVKAFEGAGSDEEHYCAFDIFPKPKKVKEKDPSKQSPQEKAKQQKREQREAQEQKEVRQWYNKLKKQKDMLDKINAIDALSKMTEKEKEDLAKEMAKSEDSLDKTSDAKKALDGLGKEIMKQQIEAMKKAKEKGEADGESSGKGKGMRPGSGLSITLPVNGSSREEIEAQAGKKGEQGSKLESPALDNDWETSDGVAPNKEHRENDALKNEG